MPMMLRWGIVMIVLAGPAAGAQPMIASTPSFDGPRVVNIVNFIRGVEPRMEMDLLTPVVRQIALTKELHLPATFLIQYDAMQQERFVSLLKESLPEDCEIGGWFEVVQPMAEAAGLSWRGRYPWDWHTHVGFSIGYSPQEREKLVDVFMAEFQKTFGFLPKSVGSWFIDAHTLAYLAGKYGVIASCNCKDQIGTDGYTLWGGYWNQAYYPSRLNALMPAQSSQNQIPIPVFRMLGSDPIYQYDVSLGGAAQSVVTLEPVYKEGGGKPSWVRWFFGVTLDAPCLAFAYAQVGQENSFGWPAMAEGLTDQMRLLTQRRAEGKVRVETLADSAQWFRKQFPLTPATAVTALEDWRGGSRRSLWYDSRFYRSNLFWEGGQFRVRDIHLFDERYPERYLNAVVTSSACTYDTLPVLDGFSWSTPAAIAGIRPVWIADDGARTPFTGGNPTAQSIAADRMEIRWPVEHGALRILLTPNEMAFSVVDATEPSFGWALVLSWSPEKNPPITGIEETVIRYRHEGFDYALHISGHLRRGGDDAEILIEPEAGAIVLRANV